MWKGVPSRRELNCSGPEIYGLSVIGDRLAARIQPLLAWGRTPSWRFFPFARFAAKLLTAHKIATDVSLFADRIQRSTQPGEYFTELLDRSWIAAAEDGGRHAIACAAS
jgi:hypothetical protein